MTGKMYPQSDSNVLCPFDRATVNACFKKKSARPGFKNFSAK